MQLEHIACYICNETETEPWASENGYLMVKCTSCGLVYLNPRPCLSDIDVASRTGVHTSGSGLLRTVGRHSPKKIDDFIRKIAELFPHEELKSTPCRRLDIGAGYGELMQALATLTASGSDLLGIEPCEAKVKWSQSRGIPVTTTGLRDVHGTFTHISLINVFSHLPNPIAFFRELRSHMEPGGQLVLVTGNAADIPRNEFPGSLYLPDHVSFVGDHQMRTVLERTGYTITAINRYRAGCCGDNYVLGVLKNLGRVSMGRPVVPLRFDETSRFRLLWIRAELCQGRGQTRPS